MATTDCSLGELVESLRKFRSGEFTLDRVSELLGDRAIRDSSLTRFVNFRDEKYCRNLVYRCDDFDMLVLCWKPGQVSPVHNHAGQCGWVRVLRGSMVETDYLPPEWMKGGVISPGVIEIDDDGVGHGIPLTEGPTRVIPAGPAVSAVDRRRAIHRLGNPHRAGGGDEPAVTLHVYARPHDSCLAFDVDQRTCRQVQLRFDTVPSEPLS